MTDHTVPPIGMRMIKTAAAVLICLLVSMAVDREDMRIYSSIAALLCVQPYAEDTKRMAIQRIVGTAIGSVFGIATLLLEMALDIQGTLVGYIVIAAVTVPNLWIAVVLSVVSLYLLCIKGSFRLAAGDLLVLVCAVCFAVHILVIDRFSATCDGVKLSCVQFLFAALWSGVCIPFFEHVDAAALLSCALPLLYVGVFSCGVGYTLQILAQKGSNPTVVTILLSLESVFAVIAGAIILHQSMTPREYLGCVLMFLAVILAQIPLPAKAVRAGSK